MIPYIAKQGNFIIPIFSVVISWIDSSYGWDKLIEQKDFREILLHTVENDRKIFKKTKSNWTKGSTW